MIEILQECSHTKGVLDVLNGLARLYNTPVANFHQCIVYVPKIIKLLVGSRQSYCNSVIIRLTSLAATLYT